jgi:hypothetical protein
MKLSINSLSPLAKFLIGMALVLVSVFLEVSSVSKYQFVQGVLMGGGLGLQLFAVIAFFKNRKSTKQSNN